MKSLFRFNPVYLLLIVITAVAMTGADEVYSKNRKANKLYKDKKYEDALKLYDDALLVSPSDNALKMNRGSALYRLGDFEKAEEMYSSALSSDDKKKKADAHFNLGNILFSKAQQMEQSGDQGATDKYKAALENYIQSLDLRPEDKDAKWNLQLAHQKVKQMQQQQQQQNQNKDNKDNKDKQDQDKNNQNNQSQDKKEQEQQKENQDKQDKENQDQQNKEDNQDKQDQEQQEQQQQKPQQQQQQEADKEEMKKEEAERIIELYADDADSLNKPMKKTGARIPKPEKDW